VVDIFLSWLFFVVNSQRYRASVPELLSELIRTKPVEFELSESQLAQFGAYFDLLLRWNQRVRLISPGDESKIVSRHVFESLALVNLGLIPSQATVLDLGTGAGFPGLPIAIACPQLQMTLLDSRRMKTLFLTQVIRGLQLQNTEVVCARAEDLSKDISKRFDCVLARAVATLSELWEWSSELLRHEGLLLAQKGGNMEEEIDALISRHPNIILKRHEYETNWKVDPSRMLFEIRKKEP